MPAASSSALLPSFSGTLRGALVVEGSQIRRPRIDSELDHGCTSATSLAQALILHGEHAPPSRSAQAGSGCVGRDAGGVGGCFFCEWSQTGRHTGQHTQRRYQPIAEPMSRLRGAAAAASPGHPERPRGSAAGLGHGSCPLAPAAAQVLQPASHAAY